jgi:protease-4
MNPPPIPKRKRNTGLWVTICILGVLLLFSIIMNLARSAGSAFKPMEFAQSGGRDEFPSLIERWSYGQGRTKAVRIPLQGMIFRQEETGFFGPRIDKIHEIISQIRVATNDNSVRAIILEVDSPGGAITPSDEIYQELRTFKLKRENRVVIAFTRDMMASGGYYAAMSADWIIAEPTAVIGSIGVIMQSMNFQRLTDDIGIRDVTIKSGTNKDLLNPFREVNEDQVALLQGVIDSMYKRFVGIVQASRSIPEDALADLADGRIFTADQAIEVDLIDQVGYWDDLVRQTAEMLEVDEVKFVRYHRQTDFFTMLTQGRIGLNPSTVLKWQLPQIMFLWKP